MSAPDVLAQRRADPQRRGPAVWASWQEQVPVRGCPGATDRRAAPLVHQVAEVEDAWRWPDVFSEVWIDGTTRVFRRVRAGVWQWLHQTRPAAELADLRAALVQCHGETTVAGLERRAAGAAA